MSVISESWPESLNAPVVDGQDVSSAALIHDDNDRILLQLREKKAGVAYPGYWGLFGGRVEVGETPSQGLQREIHEELGLSIDENAEHFSTVAWNGGGLGKTVRTRHYFLIQAHDLRTSELTLGEGADMALAPVAEIPRKYTIMPHDHLAISMWRGDAFAKLR